MAENISDNLREIYDEVRNIADTRIDLFKLDMVEKLSKLIYLILLVLVILIIVSIILIFLSLTAAVFLGNLFGSASVGYMIITGFYILLFLIFLAYRKRWLLNPILRQITVVFFPNANTNGND